MTRDEANQWLTREAGFTRINPDEWYQRAKHHLLVMTWSKDWKSERWTLSVYDGSDLVNRFRGDHPKEVWTNYIFH